MTLEVLLEPRDCPRCGRHMDLEFLLARRERQRQESIEGMKRAQERGALIGQPKRVNWDQIRELRETGQIQIEFPWKPCAETRTALKGMAFKWSTYSKRWVRKHTPSTCGDWFRKQLIETLEGAAK